MFTIEQIQQAHQKVKSGADFPAYIKEITQLGVRAYETWVVDGHSKFFGENDFQAESKPKYDALAISGSVDKDQFCHFLKIHQQGQTDYYTFCTQCAETGIEKWFVCLDEMTCTYYDKTGKEILVEQIPG